MALASSVADSLLVQFRTFAKTALDQGDYSDDAVHDKILSGLRVAAPQAGPYILAQLLQWREALLKSLAGGRAGELVTLWRSLITEALLLEGVLQLLQADLSIPNEEQARDLESLTIEWFLSAEKYSDYHSAELARLRDHVLLAAAQVLGALSPARLGSITARFLKELGARIRADASSPQRQEIYGLCHGLRFVRLAADTPAQLAASINFLDRCHPLKHVAPDKKSRLQQAICDMLTSVLQPLVDDQDPSEFGAGCPPEARRKWAQTVAVVRTDLLKWASKQSKQVLSGFPALAALTCIEEQVNLVNAIDGFIDQLHKQLRDKKSASMATLCLARCIACFLRRMSAQSDPPRMTKWVARSVAPVIQAMVRGQLAAPEQPELVRQLCAIVAHHLPDYALTGMVLELLSVDLQAGYANWEATMAGLLALLTILTGAPARLDGAPPAMELQATAQGLERASQSVWVPSPEASRDLLELVKDGYAPLEAYDVAHLTPKVSAALSRVVLALHQLFGFQRPALASARPGDATSRERLGALPVFVTALQCVPFVMPDHWAKEGIAEGICEDLPGYTIHPEAAVRQVSITVLRRCMRALPRLRDPLVGSLATFFVHLPEDSHEFTRPITDSLGLLLSVLRDWQGLVTTEASIAASVPPPDTPRSAGFASLHRVEGAMLGLLCATDLDTRCQALEVLRAVREMHRQLAVPAPGRRSTLSADPLAAAGRRTSGGSVTGPGSRRATQQGGGPGLESSVPSTPGAAAERMVFVADVIDRSGAAIVGRAYWDFGRWSDLWRAWRPLPDPCPSLPDCMAAARTADDHQRWARIMCELMKEVWRRCERSAWAAHLEFAAKLQALLLLDSNGRQVLPHDIKSDLSRNYCLAVAPAPPMDASQVGERGLTTRDFVRLLVSSARTGIESQQQLAVLALGHIHPTCQQLVAQESGALAEDYLDRVMARTISMPSVPGMGRKVRKDDARLTQAHILRVLASNLLPDTLPKNPALRDRLVAFVRDTAAHVGSMNADASPELQQLRYCLCVVARHCSIQLADAMPQAFPPQQRQALFNMFAGYCEEGHQVPGQFKADLRRNISSAKARIKDPDAARLLEADMVESSEGLEHGAYQGMAAMLHGALFAADPRGSQGRVFDWADRMLSARHPAAGWGPPKPAVARSALCNLLASNPGLAGTFVDRSYDTDPHKAAGYFQVLAEMFSGRALSLRKQIVVSLVLHKVVDARQEVRDAARGLLTMFTRRVWNRETQYSEHEGSGETAAAAPDASGGIVVVGALADSHASYQLHLSARLAKEHAQEGAPAQEGEPPLEERLSAALAREVLERQRSRHAHGDTLLCLCPWLECITLPTNWAGQWAEDLLGSLYLLTAHHSSRHAYQIQRLWATLAANRFNIIPMLEFLFARGLEETMGADRSVPASVGKQVALYLSRVAPRETIDYLKQVLAQQLTEPEAGGDAAAAAGGTPRILEFHHRRSPASAGQPAMQSLAPVAAGGASRPATPSAAGSTPPFSQLGGMDALLQTQSAWSEASSTAGPAGTDASAKDGAAWASDLLGVDSRRSSDARMGGEGLLGGGGGGGGGYGSPSAAPAAMAAPAAAASGRRTLTRPELALCLLSEIAYEHDEEFRQHLPTLLHVATLNADSRDPVVRQESSQLLVYLLYSLACKHLEAQAGGIAAPEYARISRLITRLQELQGQPLWRREQPTLAQPLVGSSWAVASFVQAVVDCFFFDTDLRDRWCSEALHWACYAHCHHCASRSHQVFIALRPALNSASCTDMLSALHKCLQSATGASLDTAVEVLCTLRALQAGLDPAKVVLFPQLLLACFALLNSSVVRVGELAMHILLQILGCLDLSDTTVQNTLLAVLPLLGEGGDENLAPAANHACPAAEQLPSAAELWPLGHALLSGAAEVDEEALGPWVALPQLVVKALFQRETELLALEVLAAIAQQVAAGGGAAPAGVFSSLSLASSLASSMRRGLPAEAAVGDAEIGLAVTLGAALPWVCIHLREAASADVVGRFLEATASACAVVGWHDLAASVAAVGALQCTGADPAAWLPPFCTSLSGALFPSYARLVFQRLMETVQRGTEAHQRAAIAVMQAIFEVPGVDLGSSAWFAEDSRLAQLLAGPPLNLLGSPLAPQVLALFQAMLAYQGGPHPDEDLDLGEVIEWPHCMDDLGELNKLCTEALRRVVEPWVPTGGSRPPELLPFLNA